MEVDDRYSIEWVQSSGHIVDEMNLHHHHQQQQPDGSSLIVTDDGTGADDIIEEEFLVGEEIIPSHSEINAIPNSLDQIAAENLIYMAQDGGVTIMGDLIEEQVEQAENADYNGEHQYFECQVTEEVEVVTDDWVQQQGEDRVEVIVDQFGGEASVSAAADDEVDVPLPTDQDEYTTSRPYPCDFCSRRFRKKTNLMNHMVAHKNDRPHICNLCGARYIRRVDLLNHLKVHAQVPEQEMEIELGQMKHRQQQQHHHQYNQHHHHQQYQQPQQQHIVIQQHHYTTQDSRSYVITELPPGSSSIVSAMQHDHHQPHNQQTPHMDEAHRSVATMQSPNQRGSGTTGTARKNTKTTKPRAGGGTAKQRRTAAAAAAAAAAAQHTTIAHHHDMYAQAPLTLGPLKKEFIHQEDMQLLIDAAQQNEQDHYGAHQQHQSHYMQNSMDMATTTEHHDINGMMQQHDNKSGIHPTVSSVPDDDAVAAGATTEQRFPIIDPDRPFVCQKCGACFARETALISHSKQHADDQPLECDSCTEMFWDVRELREHQRIHHAGQSSNSEYEPDEPDDVDDDDDDDDEVAKHHLQLSGKRNRMAADVESDADSKYGVFYCTTCGMSFHRNELLQRHQKSCMSAGETGETDDVRHSTTATAASEAHSCTVCGETFQEALDLLAHAEIHTPRYQPFKCQLCGEQFLDEALIKRHVGHVHAAELSDNTCRLCGKQCRDSRTLMKHSWEHSSEKNHSCSKCGKTFHNKARLKRHMQSHRNKSVRCDVCEEEFPDGRSLMNHRHSHTNVSGRQFPCKECGKTFGSRSSQQIHMRIHTGERPYGCRFCWKAFADGGTLRKHERIHTGEKPYACPVCPRAFNQRVVLREHIRSHHSGPDSKNGNADTPFYCTVCGDAYGTSVLLIQHLIEHSDMNTAMKRQPPTGPRKYKRRRKLKPHEIEQRVRSEKKNSTPGDDGGADDMDPEHPSIEEDVVTAAAAAAEAFDSTVNGGNATTANDDDDDTEDADASKDPYGKQYTSITSPGNRMPSTPVSKLTGRREKKHSFSTTATAALDDHFSVLNNVEHTLQNIDSLVIASSNSKNNNNTQSLQHNPSTPTAGQSGTAKTSSSLPSSRKRTANNTTRSSDAPFATRPKMIHTQKMRVPVEDPLAPSSKGTSKRRTKTLITSRAKDTTTTTTVSTSTTAAASRTKRRTTKQRNQEFDSPAKQVQQQQQPQLHHHSGNEDQGLLAAFNIKEEDLLSKPLSETEILLKLTRNSSKYSPDVVNDLEEILRSPRKPRNTVAAATITKPIMAPSTRANVTRKTTSKDPLALKASDALAMLTPSDNLRGRRRATRATAAAAQAVEAAATEAAASAALVAAASAEEAAETDTCSPQFVPFGADSIDSSPSMSRMRLLSQTTDAESGTEDLAAILMDRPSQHLEHDVELNHLQRQNHNDDHAVDNYEAENERLIDEEENDDEDNDDYNSKRETRHIKQELHEPQYSLTEPDVRHAQATMDASYTCEMCEAVFSDRAQLLLHVPIHI